MTGPTTPSSRLAGAILAGGASRRMGEPKEGIQLAGGRPMIECVGAALEPLCSQVLIVGTCTGYEVRPPWRRLEDIHPGEGPLAGLETILTSGIARHYLVAACDQPLLTARLLAPLAEAPGEGPAFFRTVEGRQCDPFPGRFPVEMRDAVTAALARGERSIRRFLAEWPVIWIPLPVGEECRLRSFNSRENLSGSWPAG
ncbi:molybdenum cofactor guanylyltransferase [Candidatus Poribacteria bacterium]|nr:molybdenum cofactor guanylyltransferase [Candidatus Poribacteria bacterium]